MTAAIPHPKQEKIKRYIEAGGLVVALEVPVIYAEEEPDDPLLETGPFASSMRSRCAPRRAI